MCQRVHGEEQGVHSDPAVRCVERQVNVRSTLPFEVDMRGSGGKGAMHNKKACIASV